MTPATATRSPPSSTERPADPLAGMAWYNGLSEAQRGYWHMVAGSCVPADAWGAFKAGRVPAVSASCTCGHDAGPGPGHQTNCARWNPVLVR